MKKDDFLKIDGMTETLAEACAKASAEELAGFIPKSRFDDLNNTKKDLESQIADRDKQLKELGEKAKGNEDLAKQISALQEQNKTAKTEYETKIRNMQLDSALRAKLGDAKYPDLLLDKFDREKLKISEDGTVSGIDEQLVGLKETYKEMFVQKAGGKNPPARTGGLPPTGRKDDLEKIINDTKGHSLAERIAARNQLTRLQNESED